MIFCLFCPFDFCQISAEANISIKNTSTQDHQCAFNRTGTLCGACHHTNSNVLGSSLCRPCHSYTPAITFALTLLFAFVGLLLLVILLVLNLSVTEGTLNSIIFYMNVVRINDSVYFGSCKEGNTCLQELLRVFVAWMNLDLEIDTCYYKGMTAIGKTALQFVFPFYLWFLCGLQSTLFSGIENSWEAQSEALGNCDTIVLCKDNQNSH